MNAILFAAFVAWCCTLSVVDWREMRLPNSLTIPGGIAVLVTGFAVGSGRAVVVGAALLFGVYLLVHLVAPAALGAGDVKAAIGLGGATALAGPDAWVLAALLAPVLTALIGIVRSGNRGIPHGPAMCGAAVVAILVCGGAF